MSTRCTTAPLPPNAVHPTTRAAWRRWLARHHGRAQGVWLVTYKVATGRPRIPYDAAVEEALCFGWIDGVPRKLDAERSLLWFAPRKPRTGWSAANKARVAHLLAAGRMAPAGLAKVEAARRDGSWAKLDAIERLEQPADLRRALRAHASAARHFAVFPRSVKRGILEWIASARRPETRARRIEETARLAARGERANQWPRLESRAGVSDARARRPSRRPPRPPGAREATPPPAAKEAAPPPCAPRRRRARGREVWSTGYFEVDP